MLKVSEARLAHSSRMATAISIFYASIGQIPTNDGLVA
jgi:hypothetical protein